MPTTLGTAAPRAFWRMLRGRGGGCFRCEVHAEEIVWREGLARDELDEVLQAYTGGCWRYLGGYLDEDTTFSSKFGAE